jgi:transcriptional regulator with XRE-family HTH domain
MILRDGSAVLISAIRSFLSAKGLSLYKLSALSRRRYPSEPARQLRPNFYSQLRFGLSPTLQQVLSLSELTEHPVRHWLSVFGFSLDAIPRLQSILSRPRTGIIDARLADSEMTLPLLRYRGTRQPRQTMPLSQLLEHNGAKEDVCVAPFERPFLYAKLGTGDALALPDLPPGSIVRADSRVHPILLPNRADELSQRFFLVEHNRGISCTRIRFGRTKRIAFALPNSSLETSFRLGTEARILGVVDLEFRFRWRAPEFRPAKPSTLRNYAPTDSDGPHSTRLQSLPPRPGALLREARLRAGLSFRCASKRSRDIARMLGDPRYFASPGTLSDYEASARLPRHIHKLFTVSILYCVGFHRLLETFGLRLDDHKPQISSEMSDSTSNFFADLQNQFGELPVFLATALPALTGLSRISLRDAFQAGWEHRVALRTATGSLFFLVNRRNKTPKALPANLSWNQPLYLLQNRDGSYEPAHCLRRRGRLMTFTYTLDAKSSLSLRRYVDAEVIGEIVAIVRSLVSPP